MRKNKFSVRDISRFVDLQDYNEEQRSIVCVPPTSCTLKTGETINKMGGFEKGQYHWFF